MMEKHLKAAGFMAGKDDSSILDKSKDLIKHVNKAKDSNVPKVPVVKSSPTKIIVVHPMQVENKLLDVKIKDIKSVDNIAEQ